MTRRLLLLLLLGALLTGEASLAHADKGSGGNSGSGGGGNSGSGGGGNSGPGGGGDDGGDDDGGNSGPGGGDDDEDDQYEARTAVDDGKAAPLKVVLKSVRARVPGEIVDVKLRRSFNRLTYRIKVLEVTGGLVTVTVDARTGQVLRVAGGG